MKNETEIYELINLIQEARTALDDLFMELKLPEKESQAHMLFKLIRLMRKTKGELMGLSVTKKQKQREMYIRRCKSHVRNAKQHIIENLDFLSREDKYSVIFLLDNVVKIVGEV